MAKKRQTDPTARALDIALFQEGDAAFAAALDEMDDINAVVKWNGFSVSPLILMLHSEGRSVSRLKALLDRGARGDSAEPQTMNPIFAICDYSYGDDEADLTEIVRLLVEAGAEIEGGAGSGSPLAGAVYGGSAKEVRALLAAGANPDVSVNTGRPAKPNRQSLLRMAAVFPDIVQALLDYGATVEGSGALEYIDAQLACDTGRDKDQRIFDGLRESKKFLESARRQ